MTKNLKLFVSPYTDPFVNLAIENYFLLDIKAEDKLLFFYTNEPCVVYGRFQNPWKECNLKKVFQTKTKLVRRQSGGGTVYHDLGNLNFSFIEGKRDFDKKGNNDAIIMALNTFDIKAMASERSDLIVEWDGIKKFSGSAFKQKKDRSFHHGTLLINAGLEQLNGILRSGLDVISSKSIDSVRSQVVNLKSINNKIDKEGIVESITKSFEKLLNVKSKKIIFKENMIDLEYLENLKSKKWVFAETPEFKFNLSEFGINISSKKGIIQGIDADISVTFKNCLLENEHSLANYEKFKYSCQSDFDSSVLECFRKNHILY